MEISLEKDGRDIIMSKKIRTDFNQAEKLLPEALKLLKAAKASLKEITKIRVANQGGSFTSLRIGVVTANALAFALGLAVEGEAGSRRKGERLSVAEPLYGREPNISVKKQEF